jgi:hypothetical protein
MNIFDKNNNKKLDHTSTSSNYNLEAIIKNSFLQQKLTVSEGHLSHLLEKIEINNNLLKSLLSIHNLFTENLFDTLIKKINSNIPTYDKTIQTLFTHSQNFNTHTWEKIINNLSANKLINGNITPLAFILKNNIKIPEELLENLIKKTDFSIYNNKLTQHFEPTSFIPPIEIALKNKQISNKIIELIFLKSNLKYENHSQDTPLFIALKYNPKLTENQWQQLIDHSPKNKTNTFGESAPLLAIKNHKNLTLTENQWQQLYMCVETHLSQNKIAIVSIANILATEMKNNNFNHFSPQQKIFIFKSAIKKIPQSTKDTIVFMHEYVNITEKTLKTFYQINNQLNNTNTTTKNKI